MRTYVYLFVCMTMSGLRSILALTGRFLLDAILPFLFVLFCRRVAIFSNPLVLPYRFSERFQFSLF